MREKINLDMNWLFHKGDLVLEYPKDKMPVYNSSKTERALWGPAYQFFDTEDPKSGKWENVNIPHDYIIEQIPSQDYNEALGFFDYPNAWYRKKFMLSKEDMKKRITLLFDGVATNATVYVNGCLMKHNFCGYTTFEVDITDVAKFDEENTIAVYVNTSNHEGWWYEGAGIYRHVWLIKTSMISVDLWGVFAKPMYKKNDNWDVLTEVTIRNDYFKRKSITIKGEILDAEGNIIAFNSKSCMVNDKDKKVIKYNFEINSPNLWSPENPYQYTMRTYLYHNEVLLDTVDTKFGFRFVELNPKKGLFINGNYYKIKGLCGHADFGLAGKAVPDNIHRYKVSLMKEMGANGYRTTHYPQASELMDELDSNGFIVMNEIRWFESTDEGKAQLEMLMKRDRNRPSVFFWSIGNEEPFHETEQGRRIAQSLISYAKKLDDSRYIMTAVTHSPEKATVYDDLEVIGINYNWEAYEQVHKKYPNKPVLSSENCATGTTRGHYQPDSPEKGYISAYDHDIDQLFRSREYTWNFINDRDWIMGGYQWIAFEHRGEARWPRLCSQSGAIDLFMQKKDAFYQNKSYWCDEPMVHLLPHWNHNAGETIKVYAYSNVSKLELFLNGESLGVRNITRYSHAEWDVSYVPGKLEVLAYKEDVVVAKDEKITSNAQKKLMLELLNNDFKANGKDLVLINCYVVDDNGNPVYHANPMVNFESNELGYIYSTGSDISDHTSLFLPVRKMREGRITVAVKVNNESGKLKINAESSGLEPASIIIDLEK